MDLVKILEKNQKLHI
jgi:hypothetical protein